MKKKIIALVMMMAMLVSMMGSIAFAADEAAPEVFGEFLENENGQVYFALSVNGDVTEFEYTVEYSGVTDPDCTISCEFSKEMTDFAAANKGILDCGKPYDNSSKVVFGGTFAEQQEYTGVVGIVNGLINDGAVFKVYSGDTELGAYTYESGMLGDVNGDGTVAVDDALLVLQHVVKLTELNEKQIKVAELNGDEDVTVEDALLILKYVVKLVDHFPVEE